MGWGVRGCVGRGLDGRSLSMMRTGIRIVIEVGGGIRVVVVDLDLDLDWGSHA